ncbi:MAG: (2Fe-2S) ferredoxin domain-containing protein, partial [Bacteroidota bacterium]|nr:(2Fe-2S) ferredoxin domain-containing protein [Bacteroidota bacterium]
MKTIKVGMATCGVSAGGAKVFKALQDELAARKLDVALKETGCIGMCYHEPLVEVTDGNGTSYFYGNVTVDRVPK